MDQGRGRIECRGVRVVRGGAVVLDEVDVTLAAPGCTVVAGPSGAGKSTLLRLCNRLVVPAVGSVHLDGTDLADLDPLDLRRRVGMVFQRPAVFDGTCRDNLLVACPDADPAVLAAGLDRVGLAPAMLDRDARSLSGGEAQRLCLARTLSTEPEILLMDEPTSSLDVDSAAMIEAEARRLATVGRPVVWVTHDLDQAERLADRIVVLAGGRLVDPDRAAACVAQRTFASLEDAAEGGA